jgi:hypothetical protein
VLQPPPPPTSLRTERLGDGSANCLEKATRLARPGDNVVLLRDSADPSGHAVVCHPDGSVTDPNNPDARYPNLQAYLAANPRYTPGATVPQQSLQHVLSLPPGPARDAAISQLGLNRVANMQVADSYPTFTVPEGMRIRCRGDSLVPTPPAQDNTQETFPPGTQLTVLGQRDGFYLVTGTFPRQQPDGSTQWVTSTGWMSSVPLNASQNARLAAVPQLQPPLPVTVGTASFDHPPTAEELQRSGLVPAASNGASAPGTAETPVGAAETPVGATETPVGATETPAETATATPVTEVQQPTEANATGAPPCILVTHPQVNVRGDTSIESTKVGELPSGTMLPVLETRQVGEHTWYKVQTPNGPGWVRADVVNVVDPDNLRPDGTPSPESTQERTPLYSQRDPAWSEITLGSTDNFHKSGCAVTSIAMALSSVYAAYGYPPVDPAQVDAFLDGAEGYDGDLVRFYAAAQMQPPLQWEDAHTNPAGLDSVLSQGVPALLPVNGDFGQHWLCVVGSSTDPATGQTTYTAVDPLTGQHITLHPNADGTGLVCDSPSYTSDPARYIQYFTPSDTMVSQAGAGHDHPGQHGALSAGAPSAYDSQK